MTKRSVGKPVVPATGATPLDGLNNMQRAYVQARIGGMGVRAAARAAGAAAVDSASKEFEHNPKVRRAIAFINLEACSKLVVTKTDVLQGFMDAVRAASSSTELTMAWREIGKIVGAYEPDRVVVSHEMLLPENLRVMTDAQLAQAAGLSGLTLEGEYARTEDET